VSILQLWHGGGRRRKSDENWTDLERQLSDAQARAQKVQGAHFHRCPANAHPPYWVYEQGVPCPWCTIAQLRGQLELLTLRPAPRPDTILPESQPASDVTAETQAVDVSVLRDAVGEGDTQLLPVVSAVEPLEPTPKVTWGVTATKPLWQVKAGPGTTDPTELSRVAGQRAVASVKAATDLDEAS
jgi:hypothetical protein